MKKAEKEEPLANVSVRLPAELLAQIDALAEEERRTRGNVIRLLLEDALEARKASERKKTVQSERL